MTDYKSLSDSELTEALNFHRRQRNMSRGINEAAHMRQTQVVRLLEAEEVRRLEEAVTVDKKNYSWGKMMTVRHGSSHSFPLHPEHQEKIKNLKDGESTSFTDETRSKVTAKREGDKVHLSTGGAGHSKTTVAHSHFTEEAEKPTYHYYVTHNEGNQKDDWTTTHSKKKPFATSRDAADHIMKSGGRQGGTVHTVNAKTGNIVQARSYDRGQAGCPRDPGIDDPRHIRDLKEEVEIDEQIKGWKHAASDLSKMRAVKGKNVKLVSLKKDGTESKMHDATKAFGSEEEAQRHHDRVTELNPKSKIRHNMYVDGKHVKTLGEEVGQIDEAGAFSYGYKAPRKGSSAYNAMMMRKQQEKNQKPIEPKDQMVGNAKVTKEEVEQIEEVNKNQLGKHIGTVNGYHIHDLGANFPHKNKRFVAAANHYGWLSHSGATEKEVTNKAKAKETSKTPPAKSQAEMDHDDWREKQAQRVSSGEVRKAVMSRRMKEEVEINEANALGWSFKVTTKKHGPHEVTVSRSAAKSVDDAEQYIKKHPMYVKHKPTKIEYVNEEVELKENPVDYSRNLSNKTDGELKSLHAIHKNQHRIASLSNKRDLMYHHQLAMNTIDAERKRRGN